MFAEVIQLRRQGEKIPDADVFAALPVCGHLCSWSYPIGYRAGEQLRVQAVTLTACGNPSGKELLPPLHGFRVTQFKRGGLIIVGTERIEVRRRHVEEYRQAWFCRPVFIGTMERLTLQSDKHSIELLPR